MSRIAPVDHPVHELIARRWSPCGFTDQPVSREDFLSLFEAARWAASSFNEQPWHFLLATREQADEFARMLGCLVEGNQTWAQHAAALVLTVTATHFARNGKPNAAAWHDIGLATATLSLEATARGLAVHPMIGILPDKAREVYGVPDEYEVVTGLALGYPADPETLPEPLKQRDTAPRRRKPLAEFLYSGAWGQTAEILKG